MLDLTSLSVSGLLFKRYFTSLSVSGHLFSAWSYISVIDLTILYVSDLLFLKLLSISDPISLLDLEKTRKEWDEISKSGMKLVRVKWRNYVEIVSHALILTWNTSVSKIIVRNNFPCLCHDCQSELRINMFMLFSHLLEAMTSKVLSELPSTSFQIPVH